ncbi:TonB-dependent receptor [Sphingobacterium hungaricum]
MKKILLLFFALMGVTILVNAQITTGNLSGSVSDHLGVPIEQATIRATHLPTGTVYTISSNTTGRFNLANLRVGGPYKVEISYVGKEPLVYDDVYIQLSQPYLLNAIFGDSNIAIEVVTVTGHLSNTQKNGTSTVINRTQIANLPSISRSVNDFTRLTPQANGTSIGGGNYRSNNFSVDGANFNNQFGIGQNIPANGSPISIDAIEQIAVNVTPFDVRESGFTGAAINAVTRSGTKNFFGSAFYAGRSDNQQGTRVEDVSVPFSKLQEKQYGFSLGGPIIKNKLFFFVNLEQNKTLTPGPTKIASINESDYGTETYFARPTEKFLNEVSSYLINSYGYDPGPYQGYSNNSNNDKIFAKIDWNISDNHKINFRYNQVLAKTPQTISSSFTGSGINSTGLSRTGDNTIHFSNSNYYQETNLFSAVAEYTGLWGNTNNTVRLSYVNQNEPRSYDGGEFPLVDIKQDENIITTFGTEPFSYGNLRDVETWTAYWDGKYSIGKNDFTYGAQFETSTTKNGFMRFGTGYYLYNSWDDFVNGTRAANYVITYSLNPDGSQAFPSFKFNQLSFLLQDQYTFNDRFKLTGGLRLEVPMYPSVPEMQTHPMVAELEFADGLKLNTGAMPKASVMVSPRIGFNYDALGDRSLILRGGTGIFTGRIPFVWIVAQSGDAGMLQATQIFTGADVPAFSPDIKANIPSTLPAAGTFIPSSISAMDENLKFPSTWKSSFAVDYKLPWWDLQASVEAIYNKDINAVVAKNVNLVDPTPMNIPGYNDHRMIYPNATAEKYIYSLTSAGQVSETGTNSFVPTYMTNAEGGHYWSVTLQLQKAFDKGFSGSIAYTKSGAQNYGDGSGDQIANLWSIPPNSSGNSNNPSLGYTTNVLPDRVVGYVSYENAWIAKLKTSATLTYSGSTSGRVSYMYSSDFNRDGNTNDLIYIPNDPSEITFVNVSSSSAANYGGIAYTAQEQSDMFFDLIESDKYLSSRKGQYVERNGGILPWRNQIDLNLTQEILHNIAGKNNSLEVFWNVFNIGNLLNPNWGVYKTANVSLLRPQNVSSINPDGTVVPTFNIGYANGAAMSATNYTTASISSTYYMQFGVRVNFR